MIEAGFERQLHEAFLISQPDPTHLNDLELVTVELAKKIPGVVAGDLLISLRTLNALVILDQSNGKVKWHAEGSWLRQHDPDINAEGNIVIYNNSRPAFSFYRTPGSNIIEFNPEDRSSKIIYPIRKQRHFYSAIMGNHQLLPNGNRLIAESSLGRVFEVNPSGRIVWDFIKQYDDTHAAWISIAERYAPDYFLIDDWGCD